MLLQKCLPLTAILVPLLILSACSLHKHHAQKPAPDQQAQAQSESGGESPQAEEATPEPTAAPPSVTVHISYGRRGDYLESLSVDKYSSATLIPGKGERAGSVVVRFEGGEPVWGIAADRGMSGSLLGHMPVVKENSKFALTEVTYATIPRHFTKQEPENSDPEPLEPGKYYIFTVHRASGPTGYQAVHITADGAAEGYEAEPRAGTSYELCCDIAPDFASQGTENPSPETVAPPGGAGEPAADTGGESTPDTGGETTP